MPVLVVLWCLGSVLRNPYGLLSRNAPAGRDFVGQKQFSCQKHPTAEAVFLLGKMKIFRKIFFPLFNQQRSFFNFCTFFATIATLSFAHTILTAKPTYFCNSFSIFVAPESPLAFRDVFITAWTYSSWPCNSSSVYWSFFFRSGAAYVSEAKVTLVHGKIARACFKGLNFDLTTSS